MAERAYELLLLPEDEQCLVLDVGCGSGLSGSVLDENGHHWIGIDISKAMLDVALDREVEGELILGDMGEGMPFKAGTFDGAMSISAIQWLCNADKSSHVPHKRLYQFFTTLFSCLVSAVDNSEQAVCWPFLNFSNLFLTFRLEAPEPSSSSTQKMRNKSK